MNGVDVDGLATAIIEHMWYVPPHFLVFMDFNLSKIHTSNESLDLCYIPKCPKCSFFFDCQVTIKREGRIFLA